MPSRLLLIECGRARDYLLTQKRLEPLLPKGP